ncbi:hypothetical protein NBH20_18090 [Rhizobium sp. S153]|uniref:Uncharacterized protein n=1 Tax=Ciceribacter sichuanensis TaxID=2949647 RepID=A0ABT0VB23_9HYPH|nr:hypothetical protein [Ciceribacter sp. S153]MCM2403082.1 hypothetical protein [Ciceribacter sp. S153]
MTILGYSASKKPQTRAKRDFFGHARTFSTDFLSSPFFASPLVFTGIFAAAMSPQKVRARLTIATKSVFRSSQHS